MSNTIDQRVVEMQFDNREFEKNIKETQKSLKEFDKSLDFDNAVKSFDKLEKATRSFSLVNIGDQIGVITTGFSTLENYVLGIFTNLERKALEFGKKIADALTVDAMKAGFSEYETQIGAQQTILMNVMDKEFGGDRERALEAVNESLYDLNLYADKTIYNFTQMTKSIGRFTAQGIDLQKSTDAVKGIANLAAFVGADAQAADSAMYMLSQAMASDKLELRQWRSLEVSGIASESFRQSLIRTAQTFAKTNSSYKKTYGELLTGLADGTEDFRNSLQKGWIDRDILLATLKQYAGEYSAAELAAMGYTEDQIEEILKMGDTAEEAATKVKTFTQLIDVLKEALQSGWTRSWQIIFGDLDEAKEMWSDVSEYLGNIIGGMADKRNAALEVWKALGGKDDIIFGIKTLAQTVEILVSAFKDAFASIMPFSGSAEESGTILKKVSEAFKSFSLAIFNFVDNNIDTIFTVFEAIAGVIQLVIRGFKGFLGIVKGIAPSIWNVIKALGGFVKTVYESFKSSKLFQKDGERKKKVLETLTTWFSNLSKKISGVIGSVGKFIKEFGLFDKIAGIIARLKQWFDLGKTALSGFISRIVASAKQSGILGKAIKKLGDIFGPIINKIKTFSNRLRLYLSRIIGGKRDSLTEKLNPFSGIKAKLVQLKEGLAEWFNTSSSPLAKVLKKVSEFAKTLWSAIKTFFTVDVGNDGSAIDRLKKRFEAFKSVFASWFEGGKISLKAIWERTKEFFKGFFTGEMPKFFTGNFEWLKKLGDKLSKIDLLKTIRLVASFLIAYKTLSAISGIGKIGKGLSNLGKGLGKLGKGYADLIKKGYTIKKKDPLGTTLLKMAAAIGILVAALYLLTKIPQKDLYRSVIILGTLMLVMAKLAKSSSGLDADASKALISIGGSIMLMALAIKLIATVKMVDLIKGLAAIAVLLAELSLFTKKAGTVNIKAASIIALGVGILLMSKAVQQLGQIDFVELTKGILALGGILLELGIFTKRTNGLKASGIILMSLGLLVMASVVKKLGKMDLAVLAKGIAAVELILGGFAVLFATTKQLSLGKSLLALIVIAGSMLVFVKALGAVRAYDPEGILKFAEGFTAALLGLSATMLVLGQINPGTAATGAVSLAIIIAAIAAILVGLDALNDSKLFGDRSLSERIKGGGEVLEAIAEVFGRIIGSFAGGMAAEALPLLGEAISGFVVAMEPAMAVFDKMTTTTLAGAGIFAAVSIAVFASDVLLAIGAAVTRLLTFGGSLSDLGTDVAGFISAFSNTPSALEKFSEATVTGVGYFIQTILGITAAEVLSAIGSFLTGSNGITEFTKEGGDLQQLGEGIARFAESVDGISSHTSDLSSAQTAAQSIVGLMSVIPSGFATWLDKVFGGESRVTAFVKEGGDLELLVGGIKSYCTALSGLSSGEGAVSESDISTASLAMNGLVTILNSVPKEGGIWQTLAGSAASGFAQLTQNIPLLASALRTYGTEISGFASGENTATQEDLDAALSAAQGLVELVNGIPKEGGLLQDLIGSSAKGMYAFTQSEMPMLAQALMDYSVKIRNFAKKGSGRASKEDLDAALSAAQGLITLVNGINKEGGTWQKFTGSSAAAMYEFTQNEMPNLAKALANYSKEIKGFGSGGESVSAEEIASAQTALDGLVNIHNSLKKTGGIGSGFFGDIDLSGFANDVAAVGSALGTYSSEIGGKDFTTSDSAITAMESLLTFAEKMNDEKGFGRKLLEFFGADTLLEKLSTEIATFGTNFKTFNEGIVGASAASSSMEDVKSAIKTAVGLIVEIGEDYTKDYQSGVGSMNAGEMLKDIGMNISGFADGWSIFKTATSGADLTASNMEAVKSAVESLINLTNYAKTVGYDSDAIWDLAALLSNEYIDDIILAFAIGQNKMNSSAEDLVVNASNAANKKVSDWETVGKNLIAGLNRGILSGAPLIYRNMRTIAGGAATAAERRLMIASPSKVFENIGMYVDLGLANGLTKYSDKVYGAISGTTDGTIDAANSMLSAISQIMTEDIDAQPVIRPVLDMTDIESGAAMMGGMFGNPVPVTGVFSGSLFRRNASTMGYENGRLSGPTNNRDVVSAIVNLTDRFNVLSDAVNNMQMVLDSGELVGRLGSKIDKNLGVIAGRRDRGN